MCQQRKKKNNFWIKMKMKMTMRSRGEGAEERDERAEARRKEMYVRGKDSNV